MKRGELQMPKDYQEKGDIAMARVAVVSGGIGGIGTATCKALVDQGRRVVATHLRANEEKAAQWHQACKAEGYEIAIYPVDVANFDSCKELVEGVESELGPIEILVNMAGITRDRTLKNMSKQQWYEVIDTDLNGAFNLTKQVFAGMLERRWGRIVNISSVNGQRGQFGQANYCAAKAGLHGFTMATAREGARKGVTVNTISPGFIETRMFLAVPEDIRRKIIAEIPVGHIGQPEDIARTVAFLTDDAAGYITGADFSINGGLHMG
jgi:acetoacetyl-CoA reductase